MLVSAGYDDGHLQTPDPRGTEDYKKSYFL